MSPLCLPLKWDITSLKTSKNCLVESDPLCWQPRPWEAQGGGVARNLQPAAQSRLRPGPQLCLEERLAECTTSGLVDLKPDREGRSRIGGVRHDVVTSSDFVWVLALRFGCVHFVKIGSWQTQRCFVAIWQQRGSW